MYVQETPKKTTVMSRFNTFVLTALILASATLIGIHAEVWSGNRTSSSKAPSDPQKAPSGLTGAYVIDPDAAVQPNSYVGISTVYNNRRYYLGVDTTAAKSGEYKVTAYEEPSYATMWFVGGLWSPTGAVLPEPNKNYQRTYYSVYMHEQHPAAPCYLALGSGGSSYSEIILTDEAHAPFWYSEKDEKDQGRFIMGFLYYKGMIGDREAYRYLAYDALYGFDRAFATKPAASQRMTRWTRTIGTTMSCQFTPATHTFGLNLTADSVSWPVTFRMRLEQGGDRFRSRFNNVEIYATRPTIIDNQQTLHNMGVKAKLDWASSKDEPTKKIYSLFETKEQYYDEEAGEVRERLKDSVMMKVDTAHVVPHYDYNNYTDTIWAIGHSPFSLPNAAGNNVSHKDYLHIHMTYAGNEYVDSIPVYRNFYYNDPYTKLSTRFTPNDHTFPYFELADPSQDNVTFTVTGTYQAGNRIHLVDDGTVVSEEIDVKRSLNIDSRPCFRDTTWQPVVEGEDTVGWDVKSVALYDTLLVSAYLADGVTPAIVGASGATAESWLQSVELTARNQIKVTATPRIPGASGYRTAMIKYIYTYYHSSAPGDTARSEQVIWVIQEPFVSHELIAFSHQSGASGEPVTGAYGMQQVPEITMDYYAIPGEPNPLPIHHDHWGYNRWYIYSGANTERDIEHNWQWETAPTNKNGDAYSQLNGTSDKYSRGRLEMNPLVANPYLPSNIPAVSYKSGTAVITYTDTLAVDVSAYTDTTSIGVLGTNSLTGLTEPTLSYRQLFAMQPAQVSADSMAKCRIALGASAKYMEEDTTYLAPIGRQFVLKTRSAYLADKKYGSDGNLQYVYYYNPNKNDNVDGNMGTSTGLDSTKSSSYRRIGTTEKRYTGDTLYRARLLTRAEIDAMNDGETKNVLVVNPRKNTGYVLSKNGSGTEDRFSQYGVTDTDSLGRWLEKNYLNTDAITAGYKMVLTKKSKADGTISIKCGNDYLYYYGKAVRFFIGWTASYYTTWSASAPPNADRSTNSLTLNTSHNNFDASDVSNYITNARAASYKLKMGITQSIALFNGTNTGYLSACNNDINPGIELAISDDESTILSNANQAWLFYEIIEPKERVEHPNETTYWQRRTDGDTEWVDNHNGWEGTELDGGGISTSYGGLEGTKVEYRLMSDRFQLAHFKMVMRNPDRVGPSTTSIITEDLIDRDYDILYDMGLDQLGKPGTDDVVTPYKRYAFNHTQFGYHYPVGVGEHQLPAGKRVFADAMPAKGEYCVINKFEKEGHTTVESCSGASQGYMYCFNRAVKPLVFIDFTYPQPTCTDQDLMLVANFCNPTESKNPRVKAEYYGHKIGDPDGQWTKIYTFLTGNLTETGKWYQLALPLYSTVISQYDMFRCVGTVSGTGSDDNADAYLLFDRFRLLAKRQLMSVFQKHITCVQNDSIYLLSRIDFKDSELDPGDVICFQYQKKIGGEYVPMETSDGTGPYTRRDAATTEVYPGYYKTGMTPKESVETPELKTTVLHKDYGMIVIPEKNYDPSTSHTNPSAIREAALHQIAGLLGESEHARDSYLDERADIRTPESVTLGESFDFGDYNSPHIKAYVNEGTAENPYWVIYLIARVSISDSEDGSFRIAMATVSDVTHTPNFANASCSYGQIVQAKGSVDMLVNENDAFVVESRETATANGTLLPANQTYTVKLRYNAPLDKVGTAMFDLFRSDAWDRDYDNMTDEQRAVAEGKFLSEYGCTRYNFREAVRLFRGDNPENPNRNATSWSTVTRASFHWKEGIAPDRADSLYNLLNRLVNERMYEVGLSVRDLYLGSSQDAYVYLFPVGASGRYTVPDSQGRDSVVEGSICDHHIWLELHSEDAPQELRFGYDKMFGNTYMVPVIRASRTDANTALPVRLAELTHEPTGGIVIGWDSTYVVETNDPAWNPATSSFRYTQDRILQESTYDRQTGQRGYYYTGDTVIFRPVNAAHITALTQTNCECFNYDAGGTTYDPANPRAMGDTEGTNVFIKPAAGTTNGCNQWHVLSNTSNDNPAKRIPGYQVANNFELHAGYWYRFRTTFFDTKEIVRYDNGGDNPGTGYLAYFILAVAPDTAVWTPSNAEGSNYWNDDNNWSAIINGDTITDGLARVPMGDTRVVIGEPPTENQLPVVNNDSIGDVTKGEVDWGFKTATCGEVLFKTKSLIYGQEMLDYNRAFVDVRFPSGRWRTFTPALDHVYSGDIYIPANAELDADFAPRRLDANGSYSRVWPYLFFQNYYNQTVKYAFYNQDIEGHPFTEVERSNPEWQLTNTLDQALPAGKACAMQGWGPTDALDAELVVRLPKQEGAYHYVGTDGTVDPNEITLSRPSFNDLSKNLSYDKDEVTVTAGVASKTYTLTNETAAQLFFFGNPTMALIDVYQLCLDNASKLEGTTSFDVYELDDMSYTIHKVTKLHQFYLSPMRAIGLMASSPSTTLSIELKTSAMIAMPGSMEPIPSGARALPKRRAPITEEPEAKLYIAAVNTTDDGDVFRAYMTMSEKNGAENGFVRGEDAVSLMSATFSESAFHTPMALYSICDNRALMYDTRSEMTNIPVVLSLMSKEYKFAGYTTLYFATEGDFSRPLYLHDALSGDSILIRSGMEIAVQTPETDQIRYYINYSASAQDSQQDTPTDITDVQPDGQQDTSAQPFAVVYDMLGRKVAELGQYDMLTSLNVPVGVYMIQRGNKVERVIIK